MPDDEAEDIRTLLTENSISYYETTAGKWGASMPAIWLNDNEQLDAAKRLIENYEEKRAQQAKADYEKSVAEGKQKNLLDTILRDPLKFVIYVCIIITVIYVSTIPFISIGNQ